MVTFVQQVAAVDYTPTVDTPAGAVVVQGDLVGITKHIIKANALGSIAVEGVFAAGPLGADYYPASAGQVPFRRGSAGAAFFNSLNT